MSAALGVTQSFTISPLGFKFTEIGGQSKVVGPERQCFCLKRSVWGVRSGERESAVNMLAVGLAQDKLIEREAIFQEPITAWQPPLKKVGVWILGHRRDSQHMGMAAEILRTRLARLKSWLCHPLAV